MSNVKAIKMKKPYLAIVSDDKVGDVKYPDTKAGLKKASKKAKTLRKSGDKSYVARVHEAPKGVTMKFGSKAFLLPVTENNED